MEQLNERPLVDLVKKQQSVRKLWPKYDKRVADLRTLGDVVQLFDDRRPGVWVFHVKSWSHSQGDKNAPEYYNVRILFRKIKHLIPEIVAKKSTWNSDGTKVDLRRFGAELMTEADITVNCDCKAQQYWGMAYINTKDKDRYGEPERRPPVIRNPKGLGVGCKHLGLVWSQMPMYSVTLGKCASRWFKNTFEASIANVRGSEMHNPEDEQDVDVKQQILTPQKGVTKLSKVDQAKQDKNPVSEPIMKKAEKPAPAADSEAEAEKDAGVEKKVTPQTVDRNKRMKPQSATKPGVTRRGELPAMNTGVSTPSGIGVSSLSPKAGSK